MEASRRIYHKSGKRLRPAHQVHDELIYVVPEHWAPALKPIIKEEVSRRPDWMPNVPLAAEAGWGPSYGEVVKD